MKLIIGIPQIISINSKLIWNPTHIEISKGEEYKFEADGLWKDLLKKCDADGYTNLYMSIYNGLKRSRENNWFALMGSINKAGDFLIGKNNQIVFNQDGNLYCYANDVKGFYWNNSGKLFLKITRIS